MARAKGGLGRGLGALIPQGPPVATAPRPEDEPRDTDDDGLLDAVDACPYAYGPRRADPHKSGCPDDPPPAPAPP